jgi:acetyltransferase-like isoleucine patch superfamily enzyme
VPSHKDRLLAGVVLRDLPPRHLCLGNPCRPLREV